MDDIKAANLYAQEKVNLTSILQQIADAPQAVKTFAIEQARSTHVHLFDAFMAGIKHARKEVFIVIEGPQYNGQEIPQSFYVYADRNGALGVLQDFKEKYAYGLVRMGPDHYTDGYRFIKAINRKVNE